MPGSGTRWRQAAWLATRASDRTPVVWLNLVCLDAPLVSIAWLGLFARVFHVSLGPVNCLALFLTAWLIYLADRLADSRALSNNVARSLRHQFCLGHQQSWIGSLIIIGLADAFIIWQGISPEVAVAGAVVGTFAVIHLVLNYSAGGAWPPLPLKEVTVGQLFAAGTLVALCPGPHPITESLVVSGLAFAGLCTLNCISIAFWERELDEMQRKVSFATRFPELDRHLAGVSVLLALGCGIGAMVDHEAATVLGCVTLSSLMLASLDFFQERIDRDQRAALADLVLLTPLLADLLMNA